MNYAFNLIATVLNIYTIIIIFRIILTWFPGTGYGGAFRIVSSITDPYLGWFRRLGIFRAGNLDFSPVIALAVLSLTRSAFLFLARYGTISIGIILAMVLQAVWGIVSFFLGFLIIVLILRLIAILMNQSTYGFFWNLIDSISRPVIYRVNRIFLGNRIINFRTSIIFTIIFLALGYYLLRWLFFFLSGILTPETIIIPVIPENLTV